MKISYNWLSTYFKKGFLVKGLPKAEKLAELFNSHAFEVESIEKIKGDTVLDVKVLPDKAHYALCHRGIARETSAIAKVPLKKIDIKSIKVDTSVPLPKITIQETNICYRYVARRIDGVQVVDKSQFKSELEAIGSRSINNIVDATNFVMFDIGQPLHAFDADKVIGGITVRLAEREEKITLLDGREVSLTEADLVIADEAGPLAIAGVKGGKRAEVTLATKSIILESANFNSTAIRRTSTRLNLRNDSSKRFENEITPVLAIEAMEHVTAYVLESSSKSVASKIVDIYPNAVKPWSVNVEPKYISSIIGNDISSSEITNILISLGCKLEHKENMLSITPPFDRLDLVIPEDIADEIGRIHGYEELISKQTPQIETTLVDKTFFYAEKVKNVLVEKGFSEVLTYSLVSKGAFEIAYPLASDKSALRESLKPKVIESLINNSRNADLLGLEAVKIFEIGKVFEETGEKTLLCIGISQIKKKKGITTESYLNDVLSELGSVLGIPLITEIESGVYGSIVEIYFDTLVSKLPTTRVISDLNFVPLNKEIKYKPFSHYPFIVRDIAFFAPSDTTEMKARALVDNIARASSGNLLIKGPDMFDKFSKGEKVSFGFRLIFQSFEKTLSDDEVNKIMDEVYKAVRDNGWDVR